jgi:hypothetical protein
MNLPRSFLPAAIATLFAGCAGHTTTSELDHPITISHTAEPITLTADKPVAQLKQYTVRLLSIAEDGTTQIQVVETQQTLTARPGECFVSHEFGQKGLTLTSASRATGTATFLLRSARYR